MWMVPWLNATPYGPPIGLTVNISKSAALRNPLLKTKHETIQPACPILINQGTLLQSSTCIQSWEQILGKQAV